MEHTEHRLENFSVKLSAEHRAKLDRLAAGEGRMVSAGEMMRRLIERAPEPPGKKNKSKTKAL